MKIIYLVNKMKNKKNNYFDNKNKFNIKLLIVILFLKTFFNYII